VSLIGRSAPEFRFEVERSKVREFARAVYDEHAGEELPPVPPTFPMYAMAAFEPDFLFRVLGLNRKRVLNGGQEYEYVRPLRIGDRLICRARVIEDYQKTGRRGGRMRFVVIEIEMRDEASGDLVLVSRSTAIETGATAEAERKNG
jgi:hypothetical protein